MTYGMSTKIYGNNSGKMVSFCLVAFIRALIDPDTRQRDILTVHLSVFFSRTVSRKLKMTAEIVGLGKKCFVFGRKTRKTFNFSVIYTTQFLLKVFYLRTILRIS